MNNLSYSLETKAHANAIACNVPMSAFKVRTVLDQIRGCEYSKAIILLSYIPYRASEPVLKVLYSAASNAVNKFGVLRKDLIIQEAYANQGPTMKRFRPRAQGRGFPIQKPTCHIFIAVAEK